MLERNHGASGTISFRGKQPHDGDFAGRNFGTMPPTSVTIVSRSDPVLLEDIETKPLVALEGRLYSAVRTIHYLFDSLANFVLAAEFGVPSTDDGTRVLCII